MNKPTKKQAAILRYIESYMRENDHSPSYREIQSALKLGSVATVAQHIDNCVAAGYLKRTPNEARSLEIVLQKENSEVEKLFYKKVSELNRELEESRENLSESRVQSIKDDISTLRAAGKLIGIDIDY